MLKRNLVLGAVIVFVLTGAVTANTKQDPEGPWKNVKVLSKNLPDEDMERVMHTFNSQLGVTCFYCHVADSSTRLWTINFASDSIPAKRKAREMMKMTFRLNKKYFNTELNGMMTNKPVVWCTTCHHGLPVPVPKANRHNR